MVPPFDRTWLTSFLEAFDTKYTSIPKTDDYQKYKLKNENKDKIKTKNKMINPDGNLILSTLKYSQHIADSSLYYLIRDGKKDISYIKDLTLKYGEEVYSHTYGDKETYWMASYLTNTTFGFNEWGVAHWSQGHAPPISKKSNKHWKIDGRRSSHY